LALMRAPRPRRGGRCSWTWSIYRRGRVDPKEGCSLHGLSQDRTPSGAEPVSWPGDR